MLDRTLTRYLCFDSRQALLEFMLHSFDVFPPELKIGMNNAPK